MQHDVQRGGRSAIWRLIGVFAVCFALAAVVFTGGAYAIIKTKNEQRLNALIEADLEAVLDKIADGDLQRVEAKAIAVVLARTARADDPRRYVLVRNGRQIAGALQPVSRHARHRTLAPGLELAVDRIDTGLAVGREMAGVATLALVFAALGVFVVGPLASRRLLNRVDAINRACDQIRGGDLSTRAPGSDVGDEFGALARHVNAMLERTNDLVVGLRDLSNRVAHDLRTPMARLKSDLELAARADTLEEAKNRAALAAVEADEILQTFEALLDIAEAEAGSDAGFLPLDLGDAVEAAVDLYRAVAEDRGVDLHLERVAAPILAERLLLVRLAANLIDNAIKFSPPGGKVVVSVKPIGPDAVLSVADEGPGVPAAERDAVLQRFVRGSQARPTVGYGLGLALVAAVAKRHGARLNLTDLGPGLKVSVGFRTFRSVD